MIRRLSLLAAALLAAVGLVMYISAANAQTVPTHGASASAITVPQYWPVSCKPTDPGYYWHTGTQSAGPIAEDYWRPGTNSHNCGDIVNVKMHFSLKGIIRDGYSPWYENTYPVVSVYTAPFGSDMIEAWIQVMPDTGNAFKCSREIYPSYGAWSCREPGKRVLLTSARSWHSAPVRTSRRCSETYTYRIFSGSFGQATGAGTKWATNTCVYQQRTKIECVDSNLNDHTVDSGWVYSFIWTDAHCPNIAPPETMAWADIQTQLGPGAPRGTARYYPSGKITLTVAACTSTAHTVSHIGQLPDWTQTEWTSNGCNDREEGHARCGGGRNPVTVDGGPVRSLFLYSRATCPTSEPTLLHGGFKIIAPDGSTAICWVYPSISGTCHGISRELPHDTFLAPARVSYRGV